MSNIGGRPEDSRILVCAAVGRDALLTREILRQARMASKACDGIPELCQELSRGCGAIIVAREVLDEESVHYLGTCLSKEPAWSHIPLVVLASSGEITNADTGVTRLLGPLRNVTLLERPVHLVTLVGILRAALADRQRQYETKTLLEQLERSNAALGSFASIASHDLKEPVRNVITYMQLLLRSYKGRVLDERAEQLIGFAINSGERMRALIDALLNYSHVTTSNPRLTPVDCNSVLKDVLANLDLVIRESAAKITIGTLPTLMGDRVQLVQLFQNLVANAIKFKGAQQPRVEVHARDEGDDWVFTVKDNGIGISMEHAERIFGMFQRLHSESEYAGTGIGLAVCKQIVQAHGGKIWVESTKGKGTTFYIAFPITEALAMAL